MHKDNTCTVHEFDYQNEYAVMKGLGENTEAWLDFVLYMLHACSRFIARKLVQWSLETSIHCHSYM